MSERNGARATVKRFLIIFAVVTNLVLTDAVIKEFAVGYLKGSAAISVIPGFFNLTYVENRGCAWGMLQGQVWPLAVFGLIAMGFLIWKRKLVFGGVLLTEILMYAGIVGNIIDRIVRGFVVDIFDFYMGTWHFPCFNVADSCITIAVGLMLIVGFFEKRSDKCGS